MESTNAKVSGLDKGQVALEKVLQLGRKASKANKTSARNWDIN